MRTLFQEVRYGARMLMKNPGFTAVALLTLALGIGANTAIFSILNSLLFHPAGISHPDRLVALRVKYEKLNLKSINVSVPDFADFRNRKEIFSAAAIGNNADFNYTGGDYPERLSGALVTWEWFEVFGVKPVLGRVFTPEEDQPNANNEVVLAYGTWKRLFGGDPAIIGKTIEFNEQPYKVVGVMGPDFNWPSRAALWAPIGLAPAEFARDNRFNESFFVAASLQPGVTFAKADAFVKLVTRQDIDHDKELGAYAKDSRWGMFLVPLTEFVFGDLRAPLFILLGAVGFVLLIACSNIAGLLLAKASSRSREFAIRSALGASRWELIRLALVETLILAGLGVGVGLLVAQYAISLLRIVAPQDLLTGVIIQLDGYVLVFTALVGLLAGVISGVAPAWISSRTHPSAALKEGGRSDTSSSGSRLRSVLVSGELALALILLVGSGLFLKSLTRIEDISTGFEPHGVMTAALSLPEKQYKEEDKQLAFYRSVLDRLQATPGVRAAAFGVPLPFSGANWAASFSIEGRVEAPGDPGPHSNLDFVTPDYFKALGISLREGRYFTEQDRKGSDPVAVIDENLARQYWPNQDPVGKRLRRGHNAPWATIVGIVAHVKRSELVGDSDKGVCYYPLYQVSGPDVFVVAKTDANSASLAGLLRDAVRSVDANQPVHDLKSMDARIVESLGPRRFGTAVLGFFAGVSLLMAALGLYALISYTVAQRTHEIGVRMALGARAGDLLKQVVAHALRLALIGVVVGTAGAFILARLLSSYLVEVGAFDPVTFGLMAVLLMVVMLAAAIVPARRATKVDPIVALRYE